MNLRDQRLLFGILLVIHIVNMTRISDRHRLRLQEMTTNVRQFVVLVMTNCFSICFRISSKVRRLRTDLLGRRVLRFLIGFYYRQYVCVLYPILRVNGKGHFCLYVISETCQDGSRLRAA